MTDMPITHCHTCGRELPWNRIFLGDRAYCGQECLPAKTVDILPDPRIAALEADLAEALGAIEALLRDKIDFQWDKLWNQPSKMERECNRAAARLLAKHGRLRILKDDEWTEGEWVK